MNPKSIPQMFFEACKQYDKKDAVMVKEEGSYRPYSHRFFQQRVKNFARGLIALGLQADEKVAILAETRFEWAIADLGIVCAGGIDVPIYASDVPDQIAYIMSHAEVSGVVVSTQLQMEKVHAIQEQVPHLRFIICMDHVTGTHPEDTHMMKDIEIFGSQFDNELEMEKRWQGRNEEDLLTIIYTSGTTGRPKGVMLTHGNLLANVKSCEPYMPYGSDDLHLSHLPLSHVLERMGGYYAMIRRGVTIAYAESNHTVAENIKEVRPTVLVSVPRLFEKIYSKVMARAQASGMIKKAIFTKALAVGKEAIPYFNRGQELSGMLAYKWNLAYKMVFSKVVEETGGRLKFMISGGAPLTKEISELFLGMGFKIAEGYGLTETSPVLTMNRLNWNKPGTVGPTVDNVEVKIAADGEILARGPNIMRGYYKNPEATAQAIVNGWFHTGDIGVLDEDGFLRITDRKKNILVTSGGKNIAPQPLENALKMSFLIEQAMVIGDRRNFITALLVPPWETIADWAPLHGWPTDPLQLVEDPKFIKTLEKEVDTCMHGFAHYEKVKKFRVIPRLLTIEDGELTPSMKIKRRSVLEHFESLIDEMYDSAQ